MRSLDNAFSFTLNDCNLHPQVNDLAPLELGCQLVVVMTKNGEGHSF